MTFLLDTNTCIRYLNGRSESVRRRLEGLRPEEIALCSVVKAELYYGAAKSSRPEQNAANVQRFASRFISLPFDDAAAEVYGRIRASLERVGTPIGPLDFLIAAIAMAHEATLVTNNVDEFSRVEGLTWEDWM